MSMILKFRDLDIITIENIENKIIYKPKSHFNQVKISISEFYIYSWLIDQNKSRYSQNEFLGQIQKELDNSYLIKKSKTKNIIAIIILLLIGITSIFQILGYISYNDYHNIIIIGILFVLVYSIYNKLFYKLDGDYTKT